MLMSGSDVTITTAASAACGMSASTGERKSSVADR